MTSLRPLLLSCVLLAAPARAGEKPAAPAAPAAVSPASGGLVVHRAEAMKGKPVREWPKVMRSWELEGGQGVSARLHEIVGTVPMHVHADTEERIVLLEGKLQMVLGDREVTLGPGDYVSIPPGVKHKVTLAPGTKRALAIGLNVPPPDPKQTTWIEPAPAPAPAAK